LWLASFLDFFFRSDIQKERQKHHLRVQKAKEEELNQSKYPKLVELTFLGIVDQIIDFELTF